MAEFESAYEWLGGDAQVRALVDRFYDLMDLEPSYQALRAAHGPSLDTARDKLYWFLYIEQFGHPRLRARHMPFSIGIQERDQWVACMAQAMNELKVDPDLANRLNQSFLQTADWMRNKGVDLG
jgi:hemoglobin